MRGNRKTAAVLYPAASAPSRSPRRSPARRRAVPLVTRSSFSRAARERSARFGERLRVRVEVDVDVRGARVPAMLLQPIVENALQHGAPPPPEPARVVVLQAEENYVRLHAGRESYLVRGTLAGLEERLDPARFIRVHRSHMVNLARSASCTRGATATG